MTDEWRIERRNSTRLLANSDDLHPASAAALKEFEQKRRERLMSSPMVRKDDGTPMTWVRMRVADAFVMGIFISLGAAVPGIILALLIHLLKR